jgi:hypothetical protein
MYATLSGGSPIGLGDGGLSLTPQEASALQHVAAETIVSRQLPAPPLLGIWPLSQGNLGNDLLPTSGLVLGDTSQVASGNASGSLGGSFDPLGIGGQANAFGNSFAITHFNGTLADIRLYSTALTASDLAAL